MFLENPSYFFPFFFFIPTFTLILSKYQFESTAKNTFLGNNINVLIMFFLQISQNCVIAVGHYWLRRLHLKMGWPTFFINIIAIGFYLEIFGFTLYDFENTRHNMQIVLPSTYVAYLGRFGMEQKVFHEFWSNIKGTKAHSNSVSNIITTTISDSPGFWIQIVLFFGIFIFIGIFLIILKWDKIIDSVFTKSYLEKNYDSIPQYSNNPNLMFNAKSLSNPDYFSLSFISIHFLAFVDLTINIILIFKHEDFKAKYFSMMPYASSLILALTHFESIPSDYTRDNIVNITRNFLPPGRFWLDTRDVPIYPEVHADLNGFCAYHPESSLCSKNEKRPQLNGLFLDDNETGKNKDEEEDKSKKSASTDEKTVKSDSNIDNKEKEEATKGKEEKSKDKEETTKDKEEATKDKGEKSKDKEETTKDKEEATKDKGEKSKDKEETTKDKEEKSKDKEETTKDKEETTKDKEETTKDKEDTTKDKEETTKDKEETTKDKEETRESRWRNRYELNKRRLKDLDTGRKQAEKSTDGKESSENAQSAFLTPEELPNVLLLLYESFNPATYLINKAFIEEHVKNPTTLMTDTAFYNSEIMPFLHNFSKTEMITFSGMQSLGLPSFSGLHSILTQEPPSQTYMNIINGWQNEADDIPSYFHMKGYRTLIVNANRFDFDGKQYWIYKKSKREEAAYRLNCLSSYGDSFNDTLQRKIGDYSKVPLMKKECSEEEIQRYLKKHKDIYEFPKFFDYAAAYYPNSTQAEAIGIDPETVYEHPSISVSGDRIVAKEIEAHWKQQKDIMKKKDYKFPLFTLASSVDGHMPYSGYDKPNFYEKIDPKIPPHTEEMRVAKFLRVNKYTDEYFIEELINWLRKNDPNTLILFTGDHGTRDIPAKEKNKKVTENVKYDPKCVHESTGSDSFFYVTGGIAYLGNDERIKKAFGFDKLAGKTIKFTVDHGDMIYTAEEILQRLQGKSLMPTNRKSRNIVDMSLDLLQSKDDASFAQKIDKSGWKSISMVSHMVEYHNGMKMIRFHPGDPEGAHVYEQCVYPTGLLPIEFDESKDTRNFKIIREEVDPKEKRKQIEFLQEALQYISAENYLGIKNRLYNYKFRDVDCFNERNCKLPDKLPDISFNDLPFLRFISGTFIFGEFIMMLPVLTFAFCKACCCSNKRNEKKDFVSLLKMPSSTSL